MYVFNSAIQRGLSIKMRGVKAIMTYANTTEDFTTYDEEDPNNRITVSATRVSWNDISRNEDTFVYKDKGEEFFSGDYKHKFVIKNAIDTCDDGAWVSVWALSRGFAGSLERIILYRYGVQHRIYLEINEDGTFYSDYYGGLAVNTEYYITVERDYDGGVNGKGRLTTYICTGGYHGEGGTDIDTLIIDHSAGWTLAEGQWGYIFVVNTFNTGHSYKRDDYIENLILG